MGNWQLEINQTMPDNKVINQEIEHPIEDHISPAARRITKHLFRHNFAERGIEEIYDFGYYLREFIHHSKPLRLQRLGVSVKRKNRYREKAQPLRLQRYYFFLKCANF